ncbi:hypothetical protein [Bacillus pumilus]|nr:hypothetical protein [Bacillus pumilus]
MPISEEIINRKGARKGKDIPHDVLILLNQGEILIQKRLTEL